jgi:hypothetical protein
MSAADRAIRWRSTGDAECPYEAEVDGQRWMVRGNDFPAERLYTLLIDGVEHEQYDSWPAAWVRPR